jgi:hypothetical protein
VCLLSGLGVELSLSHGTTPRTEAGNELAVTAVWDAEAPPELAFFQGELEGELRQVERGDQHEGPATEEQRRAQDQAEVRIIEGVAHVPIRSLYYQALGDAVILGPSPRREQGSGKQQPRPPIFATAHVPVTTEATRSMPPST